MADLRAQRIARALLAVYVVLLAAVAVWPSPVDEGAGPLLEAITRILPWATYSRIEFGANILLFVPLGLLLAFALPKSSYLVVPIALVTTVAIESTQAVALLERTPTVIDIVANATGACLGLLLAECLDRVRTKKSSATARAG